MKKRDKKIRKIFHKIHKEQIKTKIGFEKIKNLLNCKNLKLPKNYFKNKICADFGCGSTGAGGLNLLKMGAKYVYLVDLDKHIKNSINKKFKKYKKKYQVDITSLEKTKYKKNYFDFILCSGVIHHMDNGTKGLREIYRTLKKGGKCHLMVRGSGGLVTKFLTDTLRPEYKKNPIVRNFLNKIMYGNLKTYENFLLKYYDKDTKKIHNFIKKYLNRDLILTLKDRILADDKTYSEKNLKKFLRKIGFRNIYRIKKKIKYQNLRRLLSPFYYEYNHEISRALYGEGRISLMMTK